MAMTPSSAVNSEKNWGAKTIMTAPTSTAAPMPMPMETLTPLRARLTRPTAKLWLTNTMTVWPTATIGL